LDAPQAYLFFSVPPASLVKNYDAGSRHGYWVHALKLAILRRCHHDEGMSPLCGRYAITLPPEAMRELFGSVGSLINFAARYNVAPTESLPVVRRNPETGERSLDLLRWGLVPRWAKDASGGVKCINARSETAATSRMFADSFERRRCLVPATAFYEWRREGAEKIPYAVAAADGAPPNGAPMVFAGLWDGWRNPADGTILRTYAILTVAANDTLRPVHERMPVILPKESWRLWLGDDPADTAALGSLLRPAPPDQVRLWRVGKRVGSVRNDDAGLLDRIEEEASK
jgi:putative SOS response-associated peptidase YedK